MVCGSNASTRPNPHHPPHLAPYTYRPSLAVLFATRYMSKLEKDTEDAAQVDVHLDDSSPGADDSFRPLLTNPKVAEQVAELTLEEQRAVACKVS